MLRRTIFTATMLALCLLPATAVGDEARAQALFERAETHFKLGEFVRALLLYKQAYRARAQPAFLFNIGQCHRYLGNCAKAEFFFQQYLDLVPLSPHAGTIRAIIRNCKPKEKYKPGPAIKRRQPPPPPPPPRPGGSRRRVLFWTGVGVSSALLVTGAVTGGLAYDRSQTFKDPATPQSELRRLEDEGSALATASIVTLAVGGAAAVTTVLIYLLHPGEAPAARVTVAPGPLSGGGALLLRGRF